jgi:hypothetical protein
VFYTFSSTILGIGTIKSIIKLGNCIVPEFFEATKMQPTTPGAAEQHIWKIPTIHGRHKENIFLLTPLYQ